MFRGSGACWKLIDANAQGGDEQFSLVLISFTESSSDIRKGQANFCVRGKGEIKYGLFSLIHRS